MAAARRLPREPAIADHRVHDTESESELLNHGRGPQFMPKLNREDGEDCYDDEADREAPTGATRPPLPSFPAPSSGHQVPRLPSGAPAAVLAMGTG